MPPYGYGTRAVVRGDTIRASPGDDSSTAMSSNRHSKTQPPLNPEDNFVKAGKIAKIYDVDPSTVYKWADKKKIPCVEFEGIRRFHIPSVRKCIEGL
jgi:hypothetical protein